MGSLLSPPHPVLHHISTFPNAVGGGISLCLSIRPQYNNNAIEDNNYFTILMMMIFYILFKPSNNDADIEDDDNDNG